MKMTPANFNIIQTLIILTKHSDIADPNNLTTLSQIVATLTKRQHSSACRWAASSSSWCWLCMAASVSIVAGFMRLATLAGLMRFAGFAGLMRLASLARTIELKVRFIGFLRLLELIGYVIDRFVRIFC
jgi:hypothetical protein